MPNYLIYMGISLDPETIGMVFNISFFVIIGMIGLGFLIGLIRGVWKSGFNLLFVGGLVLAAFFAARPISDAFATVDLGALIGSFGVNVPTINMTMGETAIVVNITSIRETVESFITQIMSANGMPASAGTETAELILALTLVLIRYIVFILLGFIIITIGELLALILYFFPFRFIIPKGWRKKHKIRLVGGLLNAVKVTLVTVMMMIPFSSLINTINQAFHNDDNAVATGIDDPTYNSIMAFLDAYNDSLFAQVLFNWSIDANGRTLDTVLMDYVSGEPMGDYVLTLSGELYTMASIGQSILSTGILSNGLNQTTTAAILSEDIMSSLIVNLTGSALIMKALPIAINLVMNMDAVKEFVDPDLLDLDGISWADELLNIKDIALDVSASGVLDPILNGEEVNPIALIMGMVDDQAYPHIRAALFGIDNSEFLRQVLPAVLYKLVNDELNSDEPVEGIGLSTFFPSAWEDYADIRFGEEIALIYDVIHSIANLDPDLLPAIFEMMNTPDDNTIDDELDALVSNGGRIRRLKDQQRALEDNPLINIVRAHTDELIEIIIGALDDDGIPTGVDPVTGKTILFDDDNQPLPGVSANLLDSGLLIHGLDELLDFAVSPLLDSLAGGSQFDRTDFEAVIADLNGTTLGTKRVNYKGEFGAILGIVAAIFGNDALLSLLFPEDDSGGDAVNEPHMRRMAPDDEQPAETDNGLLSLFEDPAFRDGFKNDICPKLDRSRLMGAVIPGLLEGALTGEGMGDMLGMLGIDPDNLNFDFTDVGTQMGILIDIIGYSLSVMDSLDDVLAGTADISPVTDDLIGLLDSLFFSSIINPKDNDGLMTTDNYYGIMNSLFTKAEMLQVDETELDNAIRSVPDDGWTTTYDNDGAPVTTGENYHLIKFLETALTSELFTLDGSGDVFDQMISYATDEENDPIGNVFNAIDSSTIISGTMGGILDGLFGSAGGLIDPTIGSTFRNVDDWSLEGDNLKAILTHLDAFSNGIENIDFMNDDPTKVENILKAMARSQIFYPPDASYVFSDFLLAKFKGEGSIMSNQVFDPHEDETSPSPYDQITADFHAVGQTRATAVNWYGPGGEIEKIVAFVTEIQSFADGDADPINKLQNDPSVTSADIRPIMHALNQVSSMRIMLYNVFDMVLGTPEFSIGSLSLSEHNSYALLGMNTAERTVEIDLTFDIYALLEDMGLNEGNPLSMDTLTPAKIGNIDTMLNTMHDSVIFNQFDTSFENRSHALGDLTIFEQVIEMIYDTSMMDNYIYAELPSEAAINTQLRLDIQAIPNNFTITTDPDEWVGATGEITTLIDILTSFKDTGLTFNDFGTNGATAFSNLMATPSGSAKVETLMLDINASRLAHPAIPNLFDEIFTSGSFAIDGVNLDEANTDYFRDEDDQSARASEITQLIDIYEGIEALNLTGGAALDPATIDVLSLDLLLNNLHDSKVFNTFKEDYSHAANDLTLFEQVIEMVYDTSMMDTYIYAELITDAAIDAQLRTDIIAIPNNFTVAVAADDWIGASGEIKALTNILASFKDAGLTFADFGTNGAATFATLMDSVGGTAKVESLMLDINESIIAHPAIPNLFDEIFTSGAFEIDSVNLDDANTDYFRNENDKAERASEISHLLDVYEGIDNLGMTEGTTLTPAMIDGDKINILLNDLHDSKVFNTFKAGKTHDAPNYDLTVFEQTVAMLYTVTNFLDHIYSDAPEINRANLLRDDIIAINNDLAGTELLVIDGWTGPTGEIMTTRNILTALKETAINFESMGNGALLATEFNTLLSTPAGQTKIESLMARINESTIAWPANPNLLEQMFAADGFDITGVQIGDSNPAYLKTIPVVSERQEELDKVFDIYQLFDSLGVNDGTAFDETQLDTVTIDDLLRQLHEAVIFNTLRAEKDRIFNKDLTVFEQMIHMLINQSQLDTYIYDGAGPDPFLTDDIIAITNDFAGTVVATDGWKFVSLAVPGEISRIVGILEAFDDTGLTFANFSGGGSGDILSDKLDDDATVIENLLLAMNHSLIVYPAIPNIFANMLTAGDVSMVGVNFADANTHYRGNRGDPLSDDKYKPYDDSEISQLLVIFADAKDVASVDYTNLTGITNSDIDAMKELAVQFYESHVFHLEGVPSGDTNLPTVFEQIMIKMMDDTGLSSLINDTNNPNPEYYNDPLTKLDYKFADANEKATYLVVRYESLYSGATLTHYTIAWDGANGEIEAMFRIFKEMKRILPLSADVSGINPATLSPTDISAILAVLNYSDLASDAIPDLVRDAFGAISFGTYTEDKEDYYITPKVYTSADLTTMDYSITDFTNVTPPVPGPMGLIQELLSEFYDGGTETYLDMGGAFNFIDDFINAGHSSEALLHLLKSSHVFGNDVPTQSYKTRALTLYNIFDSVDIAKYIDFNTLGSNKTTKTNKLETIFVTDFDYEFEAARLDLFISDLADSSGIGNAGTLGSGDALIMRSLITNTYVADINEVITDRAYLVSELAAGFFTDIFEEEYAKAAPIVPDLIDFYASDYANLNPKEADGVEGALMVLSEIDGFNIMNPPTYDIDANALKSHFEKMGSLARTNVTGGPIDDTPPDYDYTNWDEDGNSLIAQLFYAAEIVKNVNYLAFVGAVDNFLITKGRGDLAMDVDPYGTNFVFAVEGDKISYALS